MIRLLFAASAVLLLAWDATAAVFGPRFEVPVEWVWRFDPRTRLFVRVSSARDFAVASNGTDFFVAWGQRALVGTVGPAGEPPLTTRAGVFGVRIDAAGNVLDAAPIQLPLPAGDMISPFPFSEPTNQWLTFTASSDSYLACSFGCARVDSCGTLLDANPIPITGGVVVSNDENGFALVGNQMFSVAPDATVVAHPIAFTLGSVASDGDNLLNVTRSEITLFDSNGATLNVTSMPFQASQRPAVTFDGEEYLVLWQGGGPDGTGKYVTRVSSDGVPLDTSARLALSDPFDGSKDFGLRMSFDGMNAVGAWCRDCFFERNGASLIAIQPKDPIVATPAGGNGPMRRWLALASNSTGVSVLVVDGLNIFPPSINLESFFPVIQFVTTWAPSPEQSEQIDRRCQHHRSHDDGEAGSK
jgi:hypothetical protein